MVDNPGGDQVLERLLEEGIFDQAELNTPHVVEEFCMAHAAAIGQRLLVHIERLEHWVCLFYTHSSNFS